MIDPRRRRHAVARNARAPQRLDRARRRAGALCRPAPGRSRRRSGAGQAAPRRPQPRRQPDLGKAAAAGRVRARRPVRRPRGAEGRHRHPPGAGRTGRRAGRPRPGPRSPTARRWSPANIAARAWSVLFHVTADTRWSDLPLSGSFVEMLRRIVDAGRLHVHAGRGRRRRGQRGDGGADCARSTASARSDRRPSTAKPLPRRLPRPRDAGSSARLLRPGRRPARGERAGGGRPDRAARYVIAAARGAPATPTPNRAICAGHSAVGLAARLFLIDAVIVALLGAGIAALLRRRAAPGRRWRSRSPLSAMAATPWPAPRRQQRRFRHQGGRRRPGSLMSSPATPTSIHQQGRPGRA